MRESLQQKVKYRMIDLNGKPKIVDATLVKKGKNGMVKIVSSHFNGDQYARWVHNSSIL